MTQEFFLEAPSSARYESFKIMADSFRKQGDFRFPPEITASVSSFEDYVTHLRKEEKEIPNPVLGVNRICYWAFNMQGNLIGVCNYKPELTKELEITGGNVGYSVTPEYRNKGIGKWLMEQVLLKTREAGLKRVLITCGKNNIASEKIIRRSGGIFKDEVIDPGSGKPLLQFEYFHKPFPFEKFIILAAPRTGSNMLCTMLNAHPCICCHHELFNPDGIFYALNLRDTDFSIGTMEERNQYPERFFEKIWKQPTGKNITGFKMTYRQHEKAFQLALEDAGVKKILLKRKNIIRTYVSQLIAEQTGQWEVYDPGQVIKEKNKIVIDPAGLQERIETDKQYYDETESFLTDTKQTFLEVIYENLFSAEEKNRLLNFFGLAHEPGLLKIGSVHQNPAPLKELISNFSEVQSVLKSMGVETD